MSVFQKVEEIRHFCRSGYSLKKIYEILCKSEKLFSYARRLPEFQEFVCVTEKDTEAKFLFSYYVLRHYEITEEFIQELNSLAIESLSFYHLQYLSPLQAEFLARWKGEKLFLNGLLQLNPETAKMLVQWKKRGVYLFFSFNGLTYLSKETAQILTQWSGRKFSFNGLKSIDEETAKALVKWNPKDSCQATIISAGRRQLLLPIISV